MAAGTGIEYNWRGGSVWVMNGRRTRKKDSRDGNLKKVNSSERKAGTEAERRDNSLE